MDRGSCCPAPCRPSLAKPLAVVMCSQARRTAAYIWGPRVGAHTCGLRTMCAVSALFAFLLGFPYQIGSPGLLICTIVRLLHKDQCLLLRTLSTQHCFVLLSICLSDVTCWYHRCQLQDVDFCTRATPEAHARVSLLMIKLLGPVLAAAWVTSGLELSPLSLFLAI